mmetsp:Transcript_40083/g.88001  ORF Transcript_40083/g.88001 Transcript_40083/m.88001 type:complete len:210 (-) Transcript_40083:213-842(-)
MAHRRRVTLKSDAGGLAGALQFVTASKAAPQCLVLPAQPVDLGRPVAASGHACHALLSRHARQGVKAAVLLHLRHHLLRLRLKGWILHELLHLGHCRWVLHHLHEVSDHLRVLHRVAEIGHSKLCIIQQPSLVFLKVLGFVLPGRRISTAVATHGHAILVQHATCLSRLLQLGKLCLGCLHVLRVVHHLLRLSHDVRIFLQGLEHLLHF